jgi:hypothetical protein
MKQPIPPNPFGGDMNGTTFILRIESSLGFWTARICGHQIEKYYVPFANIVCA